MSSVDALWSELKEEEQRMRRTPKASAGIPSFSTHLVAPLDNATIATAGIAGIKLVLMISMTNTVSIRFIARHLLYC
jgi:hypothetical protein